MKKNLYLLPLLALFACSPETFDPLQEKESIYYLLVKVDDEASIESIKNEVTEIARHYGSYRITNLYLGKGNETPVLITAA